VTEIELPPLITILLVVFVAAFLWFVALAARIQKSLERIAAATEAGSERRAV
jgi:hypothetical protein